MQKTKKILFDGRFLSLAHAGLGRYSCELFLHLLKLDSQQRYCLLVMKGTKFDPRLSEVLKDVGDRVEIIETDALHYSLGEQTKLLRQIKQAKPDLVHFPHFNHPIFYSGKFVVTIHDLILGQYAERGSYFKRSIYNLVINHAAKSSCKVLTVSNFIRNQISQELQVPLTKIATTYNGIDSRFKKITDPKILERGKKYGLNKQYILSVGQWRLHKNLLRLIEAFAIIAKQERFCDKLELVFVGRDDPKYPLLKAEIARYNLQDKVKFTGFVSDEDLPVVYNNAEVFCFPSLSEGFGLPGLEAQACGVPVASSDRTCMPEVYADGAHYFDPEKPNDIAEKIIEILTDDALKKKLIANGQKNARKYTWEQTAKKTLEVYREILYK